MGTADDALGHEELCTVDDEPGEVTTEKHDHNADKNASKVHLVVSAGVVLVGSNMGISVWNTMFHCKGKFWVECKCKSTIYFICLIKRWTTFNE